MIRVIDGVEHWVGPVAEASEPEPARLEVVARCPHARLPACQCSGVECSPKGKRPGRRALAECRACLAGGVTG